MGKVLWAAAKHQQQCDALNSGDRRLKTSPKGLVRLNPAKNQQSANSRVEAFICQREEWAKQILLKEKIEAPPVGKARVLAQLRPQADAVHQALETIHFAERLRHSLGIAQQKGLEIGFQATWAAELVFQLCIASAMGEIVAREQAINFGVSRLDDLATSRNTTNAARRAARLPEWREWQNEANKIWAGRPSLSKNAVAGRVRKILGSEDSIDTISRRIKKPRKAG
jgi:hypothetical protein